MGRKVCKILVFLLLAGIVGCVKDKPVSYSANNTVGGNVFIVCEGMFGSGNSSLYVYDRSKDSVYADLYKTRNSQQSLGDVFQSMCRIGDSLYLCINNSDKIIVVNFSDYTYAGTINIAKPRYIVPISKNRAYVSTLYSNKVYIFNPQTLSVTGLVTLPHQNPEGMCLSRDNVIVCPWDTACNSVYSIDAATGALLNSIPIEGYAPHGVVVDKEQMLWVLSGNVTKGRSARLTRIDPSTGSILKTYSFAATTDPIKPVFNKTKDTLYFIQVKYDGSDDNNGVYRMSIYDDELPISPFIKAVPYQYFWALGVSPVNGDIYVGDPKGFIQKGSVAVYQPNGTMVASFATGIGPGQFYFTD